MQNIYFHYAASLHYLGEKTGASQMVEKAKAAFKANDALTPEIEATLDKMIQ